MLNGHPFTELTVLPSQRLTEPPPYRATKHRIASYGRCQVAFTTFWPFHYIGRDPIGPEGPPDAGISAGIHSMNLHCGP